MKIALTTLTLNKEFKRAYYQGKFKAHPLVVSYVIKNHRNFPRIGITTSKKIGCAVKRNRCRRIIKRAYFELLRDGFINKNYDYVFVARKDTPNSTTEKVKKAMKKHIELMVK
ncbi:MAG: ribonuclease P protein component [Oscillospiraceae bacterium]